MTHNLLFFDIETVPDDGIELDSTLNIYCKVGNTKDPKKMGAKLAEWISGGGQVKAHSLSPYHNKIVALEMFKQDGQFSDFVAEASMKDADEKEMLRLFNYYIRMSDYIIGFNILNFDLPTIMFRSAMLGVKTHPLPLRRYSNRPVCDLMQVLAHWDSRNWKKLDWFAKRFGLKGKTGDGSQVNEWHKKGEIEKIRQYCRDDVELTKELFYKIQPAYLPEILTFE